MRGNNVNQVPPTTAPENFSRSEAIVPPTENDSLRGNLEQKLTQGIKNIIQNDRTKKVEEAQKEEELKKMKEEKERKKKEKKEK